MTYFKAALLKISQSKTIVLNTGPFYFDKFPDVLFFLRTQLPVPYTMPSARLLRHALSVRPKEKRCVFFRRGTQALHPAVDEAAAGIDLKWTH